MKYLFSKSHLDVAQFDKETGAIIIPREFVERWQGQMNTEYKDLSEPEKDSDRKEADKLIYYITQKMDNKGGSKMNDEIVDVSNVVNEEEMPMCLLCGNEIEDTDEMYLVKAHGSVALAHKFCIEEFTDVEELEFGGNGLA